MAGRNLPVRQLGRRADGTGSDLLDVRLLDLAVFFGLWFFVTTWQLLASTGTEKFADDSATVPAGAQQR